LRCRSKHFLFVRLINGLYGLSIILVFLLFWDCFATPSVVTVALVARVFASVAGFVAAVVFCFVVFVIAGELTTNFFVFGLFFIVGVVGVAVVVGTVVVEVVVVFSVVEVVGVVDAFEVSVVFGVVKVVFVFGTAFLLSRSPLTCLFQCDFSLLDCDISVTFDIDVLGFTAVFASDVP